MKMWQLEKQFVFLKGVGQLLQKGYSFSDSCEFNKLHLHEREKRVVDNGLELLISGQEVSDFFQYIGFHKDVLMCVGLVHQYDSLEECLLHGSRLLKRRIDFRKKTRDVLKYPIFLLVFLFIIIIVCNMFIFPQFEVLFQTMNRSPASTTWLIHVINVLPIMTGVGICFLGGLLCYYVFSFKKKTPMHQYNILTRIPFLKEWLNIHYTYHFTSQLGGLLGNGISMYQAFVSLSKEEYVPLFQEETLHMIRQLQEGEDLLLILRERKWLREDAYHVMQHGERTGTLDQELKEYSEFLLQYSEQKMHQYLGYIQPITFIGVAATVVMLYLSLMLPLFQMMQTI